MESKQCGFVTEIVGVCCGFGFGFSSALEKSGVYFVCVLVVVEIKNNIDKILFVFMNI